MRKNFGVKPWFYPLPVLIIGTYDETGKLMPDDLHGAVFMMRIKLSCFRWFWNVNLSEQLLLI